MFFEHLTLALLASPMIQDTPPDNPKNHLADETSPYLLQHVHNPVDWYPWGEAALERSRKENKPIFLSIGYSACHWCHVMERESFEDEEIARFLNTHFICIKVDREERPDIDELYMAAVQRLTGSGGWPLSVFLTPDLRPFYGGTYFPPREKFGRPGFLTLLNGLHQAWSERNDEVLKAAQQLGDSLALNLPVAEDAPLPDAEAFAQQERAWRQAFDQNFDATWGGFSQAPKFPHSEDLRLLLGLADRHQDEKALSMAMHTLKRMADGGMYDQLGGGFARYSVDREWLIPHFEKMLYDQGCLIPVYLEAWRQTADPFMERIVRESCDYLLKEMTDSSGAFWSSTDADSEGEEGKFFVWTPKQISQVLGEEDGAWACEVFGVTEQGNFEHGTSALTLRGQSHLADETRWQELRGKLYEARAQRIPPGTDDKILTAWNGLAIHALASAGRVLGEPRYTQAAIRAAHGLLENLQVEGTWMRAFREGKAQHAALLEDHAFLCRAFLSLFQATGDEEWITHATALASTMVEVFWDEETAVFWDTDGKDSTLLHRRATPWDGAIPAANAITLEALIKLHAFTHEDRWKDIATRGFSAILNMMNQGPRGFSATLSNLWMAIEEPRVGVWIGENGLEAWREALRAPGSRELLEVFLDAPNPESTSPLFANRECLSGKATLYVCRGASCLPPSSDPNELASLLSE